MHLTLLQSLNPLSGAHGSELDAVVDPEPLLLQSLGPTHVPREISSSSLAAQLPFPCLFFHLPSVTENRWKIIERLGLYDSTRLYTRGKKFLSKAWI